MPWGSTLAEAIRLFGARQRNGAPVAEFVCHEVGDFAVLSSELNAPALDRPVLSAAFELAPVREALWRPTYWSDALSALFGPPARESRSEIPSYADPSGCVVYNAHWNGTDFGIGLSIYGALRKVVAGKSAGTLWLSWSEELAARPFLDAWHSRCAWLDGCADRLTKIDRFATDEPLYPLLFGDYAPVDLPRADAQRRATSLALHHPEVLATPRSVAAKLKVRDFALWISMADATWCASTAWDSVTFPLGSPVTVNWAEVLDAKGPGYTQLNIGRWSVRSGDRAREIAAAAGWLRGVAGVAVERHRSYNA